MTAPLIALAIVALAVTGIWVIIAWRRSRLRKRGAADLLSPPDRRPLILAFSTPDCVPCRTAQKPALEELRRRYPERVEVRDIDALVSAHLARRFGIFTVPSTVAVGSDGRILAINHGIAGWEKLATQLQLNGTEQKASTGLGTKQ